MSTLKEFTTVFIPSHPARNEVKIRQVFIDSSTLINYSVRFGPLQISLMAKRTPIDNWSGKILFKCMTYQLLGIYFYHKQVPSNSPGGTWKYLYMLETLLISTKGKRKLLRVMETPSLFLLTGDLE